MNDPGPYGTSFELPIGGCSLATTVFQKNFKLFYDAANEKDLAWPLNEFEYLGEKGPN